MQKKKGISLIVLIITIIVMIILASATVITLNNSGIINKANQAVKETDLAQVQYLATLAWSEAYLDENLREADDIKAYIETKLTESKIDLNKYELNVTEKGVNVTSKDSVEENPVTNYTAEEIEESQYLYAIGATQPTYVVAAFNEDYTQVIITKNGEESDGKIKDFAPWTSDSPTLNYKDTLTTAVIKEGVVDTGEGTAGRGLFINCSLLRDVTLPTTLTTIGANTFQNCNSLTSIVMPDSVTHMGSNAFKDCTSLNDIKFSTNLVTISGSAFGGCTNLTSIELPNGVTSIQTAFEKCTNLTSIKLPNGVTSIANAFQYCTSLTSIDLPNSVTNISNAFVGCTSLTVIYCQTEEVASLLTGLENINVIVDPTRFN